VIGGYSTLSRQQFDLGPLMQRHQRAFIFCRGNAGQWRETLAGQFTAS
jgi:hypothetical protein